MMSNAIARFFTFAFLFLAGLYSRCVAQQMIIQQPEGTVECESKEERAAYQSSLVALKQAFYSRHPNDTLAVNRTQRILLAWPMRVNANYDFQYNYFNLQNYVDQDRLSTADVDYHCNSRTYDGHDASDINLFPFWWRMMDNNYVMAIAAGPGTILTKNDGNFDRNCTKVGSPNSITILHSDGSTTRYLHLKKNSLTAKEKDDTVEAGEFLGFIGSSGNSSNPHLHFAVYDENNDLIEPFFDAAFSACNTQNQQSWWQNQRAYWEPQINRLMTHSAPPSLEFCPAEENVYARNQFSAGNVAWTGVAVMDGQSGDQINCSLTKPDGDSYASWTFTLGSTSSRSYLVYPHNIPSDNTGTWVFRATYRSRVYAHFFTVGCKDNETPSGSYAGNIGYISGNYISSSVTHNLGTSGTKVLYQGANYIEFKPGFEAKAGIHLKARIKDCTYIE